MHFGKKAPEGGVFIRDSGFFDARLDATHPAGDVADFLDVPLPFGHARMKQHPKGCMFDADIFASLFYLANRIDELSTLPRDGHARLHASASFMGARGALELPAAEIWAAAVAREVARLYPSIEAKPRWGEAQFAVCITHDIETLTPINRLGYMKGRLLAAGKHLCHARAGHAACAICSGIWRLLTGSAPSWSFRELRAGEGAAPGTYFFFGMPTSALDGSYDVTSEPVRALIRSLTADRCEIGVHLGYESGCDSALMARAKSRVEAACQEKVRGARHHYLRADFPHCWRAHEKAGFEYEGSLGFAEQAGFRGGSALPYRPFDVKSARLLSPYAVPLVAMDGTFFHYMGLSGRQTVRQVLLLAETVRSAGGVFTLLWHNTMADGWDKPAQARAYRDICTGLREMGGTWMSAGDCVAAWRDYERSLEVSSG